MDTATQTQLNDMPHGGLRADEMTIYGANSPAPVAVENVPLNTTPAVLNDGDFAHVEVIAGNVESIDEITTVAEAGVNLVERIYFGRSPKKYYSVDIVRLVPPAFRVGTGDKVAKFFNHLAGKLQDYLSQHPIIASEEGTPKTFPSDLEMTPEQKFMDVVTKLQADLSIRKNINFACSCGCKDKHANAMAKFFIEYFEAIDLSYRASKNFMSTLGSSNMTLATAPISEADKIAISNMIMADQLKHAGKTVAPTQAIPHGVNA